MDHVSGLMADRLQRHPGPGRSARVVPQVQPAVQAARLGVSSSGAQRAGWRRARDQSASVVSRHPSPARASRSSAATAVIAETGPAAAPQPPPPTSAAPSVANCGLAPGATAAAVFNSPSVAGPSRSPTLARTDVPFPYVALACPGGSNPDRRAQPVGLRPCLPEEPSLRTGAPRRRPRQSARQSAGWRGRRRRAREARRPSSRARGREASSASVRHVRDVRRSLGQLPAQPRIDRPEGQLRCGARRPGRRSTRASSPRSRGRTEARSRSKRSAVSSAHRAAVRRSRQTIAGYTGRRSGAPTQPWSHVDSLSPPRRAHGLDPASASAASAVGGRSTRSLRDRAPPSPARERTAAISR